MGAREAARHLAAVVARAIWTREQLVVFEMRPEQLNPVAPESDGEAYELRSTPCSEFLWTGTGPVPGPVAGELREAIPGQRFHWIEVVGQPVSWGFSAPVSDVWPLAETRSRLRVPPGSVCLTTFETIPTYRGRRLYPAVLTAILQERFGEGAPTAYIWCRPGNVASYRAIRRVGFRESAAHEYVRFLGLSRRRESSLP